MKKIPLKDIRVGDVFRHEGYKAVRVQASDYDLFNHTTQDSEDGILFVYLEGGERGFLRVLEYGTEVELIQRTKISENLILEQ